MKKKIFALGFFDGVHLGHQALLRTCCQLSETYGCTAAAMTFDLPPHAVLSQSAPNMLTSAQDRERLLHQYGIQEVTFLSADLQTLSMPWQDFLETLLRAGAVGFVCGEDFRFGAQGSGTADKLAEFSAQRGLPCVIVQEQEMGGEKISSTRIRSLLEQGDVENANLLLGHPHILTETVVPGRQLGRTIGIPTANLHLPEQLLIPAFGVYACTLQIAGQTYAAVTNIGIRPTVSGHGITVEPWILDYQGDLYGKSLTLQFHHFLRPEQKFDSLAALQQQIQLDAKKTRSLLGCAF